MIVIIVLIIILIFIFFKSVTGSADSKVILYILRKNDYPGAKPPQTLIDAIKNKGYKGVFIGQYHNLPESVRKHNPVIVYNPIGWHHYLSTKWAKEEGFVTYNKIFKYYKSLEESGILVEKQSDFMYYFDSKKYYADLDEDLLIPGHKTLVNKSHEEIIDEINKSLEIYDKIVIKKGFSGGGFNVVFIDKGDDIEEKSAEVFITKFSAKYHVDSSEVDEEAVILIQPYNAVVADRKCEFRFIFIASEFSGVIPHGADWSIRPPKSYANESYNPNDEEHVYMLGIAKRGIEFANNVGRNTVMRIDISYATDFLDEYMIEIKGQQRRYYINEIEATPTLCSSVIKKSIPNIENP